MLSGHREQAVALQGGKKGETGLAPNKQESQPNPGR